MVLICNNEILTLEKFELNRCLNKNEIKNVYKNLKNKKTKNELEVPSYEISEIQGTITGTYKNDGIFTNKSKKHECRKNCREGSSSSYSTYEETKKRYNDIQYDPYRKYSDQ